MEAQGTWRKPEVSRPLYPVPASPYIDAMPRKKSHPILPLPDQVALVLQGGGALGSYQAGVYEQLYELDIELDWVAGISIGAVNAAIIAGNRKSDCLEKLKSFWTQVSGWFPDIVPLPGNEMREMAHLWSAGAVTAMGVPGFFAPHLVNPFWAPEGSNAAISYYDTTPLIKTLDELVDWDRVNHGPMRFSVGAVDVESGNFAYFDNRDSAWKGKIDARHVLASGALPPGFPPVEIDGRYYWDGGLVSNTPLQHILDHQEGDMLIFQVDLFPAEGALPRLMSEVWSREKDIRYSSRTRMVTDQYLRARREHKAMCELLDILPPDLRETRQAKKLESFIDDSAVNIVHLIYRNREWETGARDFEFSNATMKDHWQQGQEAVQDALLDGDMLAQNISDGKTAAFDVDRNHHLCKKDAKGVEP